METIARSNVPSAPQANALEASFRAIGRAVGGHPHSDILAAKARGLMIGYHAKWERAGWHAEVIQPGFHLSIVNPATGRRSRTFTLAGRPDAVVVRDRSKLLLESKTVGEDLQPADAPVWRRLAVDMQAILYVLAQRRQGSPVAGVLYDLLRRPHVRPRVIPKGTPKRTDRENVGTRLELQKSKTYFGWPVDQRQTKAFFLGTGQETPELYSLRVAADTLRRPAWYFQRRIVKRTQKQLAHYEHELWQTAVEIRLTRRAGRHYRNSAACMAYNVPCPYLPICSGRDKLDSDRWRPLRSIHPELSCGPGHVDERRVLTHSRMQCFKLCRRKHYYRYELGIVPAEPPENDTLRFSQVIRRALAAWWENLGTAE